MSKDEAAASVAWWLRDAKGVREITQGQDYVRVTVTNGDVFTLRVEIPEG